MFGGEIVAFNTNLSYVILITTLASPKSQKTCTGVAFRDNVVITAAHCIVESRDDRIDKNKINVILQGPMSQFTAHEVVDVFVHPHYEPKHTNDLSVIKTVKLPVIRFPKFDFFNELKQSEICLLPGFGARYPPPYQTNSVLAKLHMRILKKQICANISGYQELKVICVPVIRGIGPCHGDSGGPIICNGTVRGILSRGITWGEGCGMTDLAVLFYEDFFEHRVWLHRITQLPLSTKLLLILLMVLMPQATPLVVSKVRLYNKCSYGWVRVNRNGTVFAPESVPNEDDGQNNLSIRSKDFSGKVIIFAESSKMYLCYNRRWKLIGSKRYRGEMCLFTEEIFDGYNRFRPVKDPERLVGFQRNGRPLRAKKSRNKACHNFVKSDSEFSIPVHNTIIAMQNAPKVLEEITYTVERSRPHRHQRHRDAQKRARLRFSPNATI